VNYYSGTNVDRRTPVEITLPENVKITSVSAGLYHTVALSSSGQMFIWGAFNKNLTNFTSTLTKITNLPSDVVVTAVAAGFLYTVALTSTGLVYAWEPTGVSPFQELPFQIIGLPIISSISVGVSHLALLTSTGQVITIGDNQFGQVINTNAYYLLLKLGDGTFKVHPLANVIDFSNYTQPTVPIAVIAGYYQTAVVIGGCSNGYTGPLCDIAWCCKCFNNKK
jgi:alpha-tubulin suppressor-like RCC1 family protein